MANHLLIDDFHAAILAQNLVQVTDILDAHPEIIDTPTVTGQTPLSEASMKGDLNVVNLLLARGSRAILTPNHAGVLPIHFAAENGNLELIWRLLDATPINDGFNRKEQIAIMEDESFHEEHATPIDDGSNREDQIQRHLLAQTNNGNSPLHIAIMRNRNNILEPLLRRGPNAFFLVNANNENVLNIFDTTPPYPLDLLLRVGIELFGAERIRPLIIANTNTNRGTIHRVISYGSDETVKEVLRIVPDMLDRVPTPYLLSALETFRMYPNRSESFELLLTGAKDVSISYLNRLLHQAARRQCDRIFAFVDSYGEHRFGKRWTHETLFELELIDTKSISLLGVALRAPTPSILKQVLDKYLKVMSDPFARGRALGHTVDQYPRHTLIHAIAHTQNVTILDTIIQFLYQACGPEKIWASLRTRNWRQELPIQVVIRYGHIPSIEYLIQLGNPFVNSFEFMKPAGRDRAVITWRNLDASEYLQALFPDISLDRNVTKITMEEKEILQIRRRAYFNPSLTSRLLFWVRGSV